MGATVSGVQPPAEAKYDPEIVRNRRRMNWKWTGEPGECSTSTGSWTTPSSCSPTTS
ncbi:MAG: hypothetical protein ACLR3C_03040 [Eggerthella lenta]